MHGGTSQAGPYSLDSAAEPSHSGGGGFAPRAVWPHSIILPPAGALELEEEARRRVHPFLDRKVKEAHTSCQRPGQWVARAASIDRNPSQTLEGQQY